MTSADPAEPPLSTRAGGVAFTLAVKEWETDFFGRRFASLTSERTGEDTPALDEACAALGELSRAADVGGFAVSECHVDLRDFWLAAPLETVGFRLVDSRMRFLTRFAIADIPDIEPSRGVILDASPEHRGRIVELTHDGFTENDRFVSRFKNPVYFTLEESRRYFEAWIDNTAFDDDSASAVFVVDGRVVGYYIYQARDTYDGLPVVKGILTAVEPEHRGANAQLAMQAYLYRKLGFAEWYLDNTTQLTNVPVIRNHIRSSKQLEELVLTFYRLPGGAVPTP